METIQNNRNIYIEAQKTFFSKRNVFVRYWYQEEMPLIISDSFNRYDLDRNVLLYHSELYNSERNIYFFYYNLTINSEKNILVLPLVYYPDNREIIIYITGVKSLNTINLDLPFLFYTDKILYLEQRPISYRHISICYLVPDYRYCKISRNISRDINETNLDLPFLFYGDRNFYVEIGFTSKRNIIMPIQDKNERFISIYFPIGMSINETDLSFPLTSYTEKNIYLVGHSNSERNISLKLNQFFSDKYMIYVPFRVYKNFRNMEINIRQGKSVNETDLLMTYYNWTTRFIELKWHVYNSEKKLFLPTTIQSTYISRTPLDVSLNVKDLEKTIEGFFDVGIESMIIKDEDNNLLSFITYQDYESNTIQTKIKNLFPDRERVKRIRFEIFTSQGQQIEGKKSKLLYSGYVKGQIS